MKANYDRLVTYLKKTDDSIMVSALFQRILTVAEATVRKKASHKRP